MAGPWEKYAPPAAGPWERYAATEQPAEPASVLDKITTGLTNQAGAVARGYRDVTAGAMRGAGSIGATLLAPVDIASDMIDGKGLSLESNRERRAKMDEALRMLGADTDSGAFSVGKLGAEVAGTSGVGGAIAKGLSAIPMVSRAAPALVKAIETSGMTTGAAPSTIVGRAADMGARMLGGALTGGASAGLVNPEEAAAGAAIGGVMPPAMKAAGAVGRAVGGAFSPNINNPALARKAIDQYGIPLGPADVSSSRMTRALRSVLNDAPITGGIGERQSAAVQEGFNRAVGETFGAPAVSLTPAVMDSAKKRMGAEFDRIWGSNLLQVDGQMVQKLSDLQTLARKLPRNEGASLEAEIQDLLQKTQVDQAGNIVIPGDTANKFQSYLRRRAEGSAGLRNELNDLRQTIIGAFNRGVSPADAAALTTNRTQYKAFKTIEPLLAGAEAGVAGRKVGDVPAGLLPQAVRKSYGSGIAGSPFEDLSQIGSQYLADRVARTGGGPRAMIQNSAIGSALGFGALQNPLLALPVIPAAAGVQAALGSPTVTRRLLQSGQTPSAISALFADPRAAALVYRGAPVAAADR